MNFREKISLNVFTNVLRTLAMALIGIFMVPYYVDTLGIASYAIIPLATMMSSYIQLITETVANSSTRYSTLTLNTDGIEEANRTSSTAFFGLGRLCLFFLPIGILLAILSPVIFNITGSNAADVQILFAMIIISSLIVTMSIPFNGVFYATNDLYLLYTSKFAYSVSQIAVIIFLFTAGTPSLAVIGVGYLASSCLVFVMLYILAKRTEKGLRISRSLYDADIFKRIGSLGFWSTLNKVGDLLFIQLSMVLVNLYLGSEVQGGFAMIATIVSMMGTTVYTITDSIDPIILKCYGESKKEEMIAVLYTGLKMITIIMAFPSMYLVVFSEELLGAWVGTEYAYLSKLMAIGVLGNLAFCTALVSKNIPTVYLKVRVPTLVTFVLGLVNAAGTVWVLNSQYANVESAMVVWAVTFIALAVFTVAYSAHLTGAPKCKFLLQIGLGYVLAFILYPGLNALNEWLNLPPRWIPVLAVLMVTYLAYLLVSYVLFFTRKEKDLLSMMLPGRLSKFLPKISLR